MRKLIIFFFVLVSSCVPEKSDKERAGKFVYIFTFPEGVSDSSQDLVRSHVYFNLPGENLTGENFSQIEESFLSSRMTISYFKDDSEGMEWNLKEEDIVSDLRKSGVRESFMLKVITP